MEPYSYVKDLLYLEKYPPELGDMFQEGDGLPGAG